MTGPAPSPPDPPSCRPPEESPQWTARHLAALVAANIALAFGPLSVRLADSGPVSAGFWRLLLPLPLLFLIARANRQPLTGFSPAIWTVMLAAGVVFALDIASWHVGIEATRLGNSTLFGNAGSLIVMAWGVIALRRLPNRWETAALVSAIAGSAILMGRSLEIGTETLAGDLFCLLAGFFYAIYILLLQSARANIGSWSLLAWSSVSSVPLLIVIAVLLDEPVWPHNWWPLVALALGSQLIGQGLLVYSLKHFPPLVIGMALLTQPGIGVISGWFAFGEAIGPVDLFGMALVAAALALARGSEPAAAVGKRD